ncbi:MAG: hypothetical protein QOF51_382 [Chloroflexota bacterium]|jgi:drug/metabolite transporter (DMT)-like permease|nr:hypothetical protein [Chloroflexota bacterium]
MWVGRILVEPLVATVLWGGVFTAAKLGMREIPVLPFIAVRILLAAILLLVFSGRSGWPHLDQPVWRALVGAGLAQTSFQVLLLLGIQLTTASISAILLATAPLLTAGWLAATGRQRLGTRQWFGLGIGLAGVALVVGASGGGGTLLGNVLALAAAFAWTWYGIAIGPLARAVGSVRAAASTLVIAGTLIVPFGVPDILSVDWAHLSPTAWMGLLYGATLGLVVATVFWVRSIEQWGPQATAVYGYIEPVAAVVIAALLLGETLGPIQAAGAVLALAGVYLASGEPAGKRSAPPLAPA